MYWQKTHKTLTHCLPLLIFSLSHFACNNTNETIKYVFTADSLYQNGEVNASIPWYSKAIESGDTSSSVQVKIADAYRDAGDFQNALHHYNSALEINSENADAYAGRGSVNESIKEKSAAILDYTKAIALNSRCYKAYNNRAAMFMDKGDLELALSDINHAIEIDSTQYAAYNIRGMIAHSLGKNQDALKYYSKSLSLKMSDIVLFNRCVIELELELYDDAFKDADQAISIFPNEAKYYLHRGYAEYYLKRNEDACSDFLKAKEMGNPEAASYYEKLCSPDPKTTPGKISYI